MTSLCSDFQFSFPVPLADLELWVANSRDVETTAIRGKSRKPPEDMGRNHTFDSVRWGPPELQAQGLTPDKDGLSSLDAQAGGMLRLRCPSARWLNYSPAVTELVLGRCGFWPLLQICPPRHAIQPVLCTA